MGLLPVNTKISIGSGIQHIYDMNYLWGFTSALLIYYVLNYFFPAQETLLKTCVYEDIEVHNGVEYRNDGVHTPTRVSGTEELPDYEKKEPGVTVL